MKNSHVQVYMMIKTTLMLPMMMMMTLKQQLFGLFLETKQNGTLRRLL